MRKRLTSSDLKKLGKQAPHQDLDTADLERRVQVLERENGALKKEHGKLWTELSELQAKFNRFEKRKSP